MWKCYHLCLTPAYPNSKSLVFLWLSLSNLPLVQLGKWSFCSLGISVNLSSLTWTSPSSSGWGGPHCWAILGFLIHSSRAQCRLTVSNLSTCFFGSPSLSFTLSRFCHAYSTTKKLLLNHFYYPVYLPVFLEISLPVFSSSAVSESRFSLCLFTFT